MAKVLFVTWSGGGNQPPAFGLAQELRRRGHESSFAGYESQRTRVGEFSFPFIPLERSSAEWRPVPPEQVMAALVAGVWACPAHRADVADAISNVRPHLVVVDCLMVGAMVAAATAGIPVAVLVHSAPGLLVPPGGPMDRMLLGPVNELRAGTGWPAVRSIWETWARFPTLCASIPELDPLAAQVPPSFIYVGPINETAPASGWQRPWVETDRRPLILVSFSTGKAWDQTSRIGRTLAGLAGRPYRVLVTSGAMDVSGLAVPTNATLVPHLPHAEILPAVAVTVTHAGHGTVAAALAAGVPMVCLPNPAADQPALAARVAALGAGLTLNGETATATEIAEAVDRVLADRSFAFAAQGLATTIAATPGAATARTILEGLLA